LSVDAANGKALVGGSKELAPKAFRVGTGLLHGSRSGNSALECRLAKGLKSFLRPVGKEVKRLLLQQMEENKK
jgi:hypothetical protein